MRIRPNESTSSKCAKQCALVRFYAAKNPLKPTFVEGTFFAGKQLDKERRLNEEYRELNGPIIYKMVSEFIDAFEGLDAACQRDVFYLSHRKYDYLIHELHKKVRMHDR